MSRKKTPKSKGASAPAASALPASNGPRPARPGTARPGPQAPLNGPPQPARPSLGGGGDFYDVAFKVMLVGDSGVGKTCLLVRFKDGAFLAGTFISTVGIDFRNKVLDVDGTKVKLQIWDTAGQERFRSVTHAYYRDAHALLLLYDVTNKASFDNIQLHQPDTLDDVPVRGTSAWHLGSSSQTPPVRQSPTGTVYSGAAKGASSLVSALPTGLADGDPGVCPAQRGAHAAREQGGLHPGACGEEGGWGEAGQGVWAAFHGDQCQDRPQRGLGLHSHSKGVEAALREGPQRAPLRAARLCQEGGPWGLLLQTLNLARHSHWDSCCEAQAQPSPCKSGLQVSVARHPVVNPGVPVSRSPRLSLAILLSWWQSTASVLTNGFQGASGSAAPTSPAAA